MPSSKAKLLLMVKNSMSFPIAVFPVTLIGDIPYFQSTKTLAFSLMILTSVKITIWPFILSVTIVQTIFKTAFVLRATFEGQLALSVEFSLFKVASVGCSIFEDQSALAVIEIVQKFASIGDLISNKSALDPFSFFKSSLESYPLGPFFGFPVQQSILKLSVDALLFSNYSSQALREIVFIESEIVKAICIIFTISISFGIVQLSFVERFVRHGCELKICNGVTVICPKFLYICSDFS